MGRLLTRVAQRGQPTSAVRRVRIGDPGIAESWQRLQAAGGVSTPFHTWQWASGLITEPDTAAGTWVVVVERGDDVVGLLPIERVVDARGLATVGPAGWRWLAPDHLDVVARPTDRHAVGTAIARYLLTARGVDVVDLDGMAPDGGLAHALGGRRFGAHGSTALRLAPERTPVPYLRLDDRPVIRSASLRSQVGRGRRRSESLGGGFDVVTEPARVGELMAQLMDLHVRRFGATSEVFSTDGRRAAHRQTATQMAAAGLARIYRLRSGEVDVALLYALCLERTVFYYSSGMVDDASLSPGRTLLGLVALSAAEEGFTELDLLRGEHAYKQRFANASRENVHERFVHLTPAVARAGLSRVSARLRPA